MMYGLPLPQGVKRERTYRQEGSGEVSCGGKILTGQIDMQWSENS